MKVLFDKRHNLFMMVQEALNNIVKHANADRVDVGMKIEGSTLTISIRDNGCGFSNNNGKEAAGAEPSPDKASMFSDGLRNIKKRVAKKLKESLSLRVNRGQVLRL